jgi:anti-anti-sigma regulatory factor
MVGTTGQKFGQAVRMATIDNLLNVDEANVVTALQEAAHQLERVGGEMVLDFSSVRRLDSSAVRAIEKLASIADEKAVKVALRGVNIDLYKTLKLMKLTHRFTFVD